MIYKICRLFFFLFYFFFQSNVNAQNIAYIDIDYIINNSLAGKDILIQLKQKFKAKDENFKDKENKFKKKEKQLLAQKNILDSNEYKKKLLILKNEVEGYKKEKNVFLKEFNRIKLEYTKLMLEQINPILEEFSREKSIGIILQKKNIVIGKSSLDITNEIIKILDNKIKKIKLN